jgi:hypothetical protein
VLDCRHSVGGNGVANAEQMPISENARSAAAIHRKLRAPGAVFLDPAATEHEKANAKRLKERLEEHLDQDTTPSHLPARQYHPGDPPNARAMAVLVSRRSRCRPRIVCSG